MENKKYVIITANENGDIRIKQVTTEELKEEISQEISPNFISPEFLKENPDPMYWIGMLIIKGEIVIPEPKQKVTEWEI